MYCAKYLATKNIISKVLQIIIVSRTALQNDNDLETKNISCINNINALFSNMLHVFTINKFIQWMNLEKGMFINPIKRDAEWAFDWIMSLKELLQI